MLEAHSAQMMMLRDIPDCKLGVENLGKIGRSAKPRLCHVNGHFRQKITIDLKDGHKNKMNSELCIHFLFDLGNISKCSRKNGQKINDKGRAQIILKTYVNLFNSLTNWILS